MHHFSRLVRILPRTIDRIRPLGTLPNRLGLNVEGRINSFVRTHLTVFLAKYYDDHFSHLSQPEKPKLYLRSKIHPYPGLGHQVSVWLSGFLWADDLGLEYLGGVLSRNDGLLKISSGDLPPVAGGRLAFVRLPPTDDERKAESIVILRGAVTRARRRHATADAIIFTSALDNPRNNQIPAEPEIRQGLLSGSHGDLVRKRENDGKRRMVIHVRRGDISQSSSATGTGLSRWVTEEYYAEVIRNLRAIIDFRSWEISVISLGKPVDFPVLGAIDGVTLHLNGTSSQDMAHLASADILVAAPSSFSFTAALASKGAVLALYPWWHEVPDGGRWFRLDESGVFDESRLKSFLSSRPGIPSRSA